MREKFFYIISWSIILCLWLTFLFVPMLLDGSVTGRVVQDNNISELPIFFVFLLLFLGVIFIVMTRVGSTNEADDTIDLSPMHEYVHSSLRAGFSSIEIRKALIGQGWETEVVDAAIQEIEPNHTVSRAYYSNTQNHANNNTSNISSDTSQRYMVGNGSGQQQIYSNQWNLNSDIGNNKNYSSHVNPAYNKYHMYNPQQQQQLQQQSQYNPAMYPQMNKYTQNTSSANNPDVFSHLSQKVQQVKNSNNTKLGKKRRVHTPFDHL
jgi:hypothetical protein